MFSGKYIKISMRENYYNNLIAIKENKVTFKFPQNQQWSYFCLWVDWVAKTIHNECGKSTKRYL